MWAFAIQQLGLTGEQFWGICPREYYALRDAWEIPWDRRYQMWASELANMRNCWRGADSPVSKPSDFWTPRKQRKIGEPTRQVADPLCPGATQTVEEKRFFLRSILAESANLLPDNMPVGAQWHEIPESQRKAVEAAWADYQAVTGQKPN